ncbi:hypothetical protein N7494_008555 [Penicillium frequentans]|uniref:Uncharacterized protein n=1 Tax=Penicillium frequentans TaxID=3151616 RepID=A0AAD6CQW6_9EURO|nr:hypothetical protein N7494_008555 [Penicillium glabrum]
MKLGWDVVFGIYLENTTDLSWNTVINDLDNEDGPLASLGHASSRKALGFLCFRYYQGCEPKLEDILFGSFYRTRQLVDLTVGVEHLSI